MFESKKGETRLASPPFASHGMLESARASRCALSSKAVAAVDWAVASRSERHRRVRAAFGANYRVHLTTIPSEPVVVALASLGPAAGRAALGFVGVTLFRVVRLVIRAEREGLAALVTGENSVLVSHP